MTDEYYLQKAIELARKGSGYVNPNPMVGCVIAKNGEIVGEGYHACFGKEHAEVVALRNAGENAQGGGMSFLVTMALIGFVFYFLLIRPQSKQAKSHQQLLDGLKRDDMVVTTGGIHGKITNVAEAVVTVEIATNVRIKVTKKNIAGLSTINKQQDEKKK